jgi:hypothetical protein
MEVEDWAYDALKALVEGKADTDKIFPNSDSSFAKLFITDTLCPSASPKTFRSAIGTETLVMYLKDANLTKKSSMVEKKQAIVMGNFNTAKKLNHQKNVAKKAKEIESKVPAIKEKIAKYKDMLAKAKTEERKKKIKAQIKKLNESIAVKKFDENMKKETANVALGTSLNSYINQTVIISWCKDVDYPLDKIYTKTQIEKFSGFVESTDENYWHQYWDFIADFN